MLSINRASEITIPQDNPFQFDKLGRKDCAKILTNLVNSVQGPLVISINGAWGTGKTSLLKMWVQSLSNDGFTCLYFSAWEDDYHDDALVSLIGQIWDHLKETDYKEIVKTIKECAAPVIRNTVFNAVRLMTGGVIDLSEDQLKSVSENVIDEYLAAGNAMSVLRNRLETLANSIRQTTNKPLIVIVDELDRCRPTYAIEVLEKIKHLFSIPGIVFLLGIDKEQISHSIRCIYGQGMDVDGYLRRFIDLELILPHVDTETFIKHLFEQTNIRGHCNKKGESIGNIDILEHGFSNLCILFKLSLRDIEHCFILLTLVYSKVEFHLDSFVPLLSILIVMKLKNGKLYKAFSSGDCTAESVIDYILDQPYGANFLKSRPGEALECKLVAVSPVDWRDSYMIRIDSIINKKETHISYQLPDRIKNMPIDDLKGYFDYLTRLSREHNFSSRTLKSLSRTIELASLMVERQD